MKVTRSSAIHTTETTESTLPPLSVCELALFKAGPVPTLDQLTRSLYHGTCGDRTQASRLFEGLQVTHSVLLHLEQHNETCYVTAVL
ncbi:hypothetical protein E2C01_022033 [Portunus trituberculatus]|uniref:Uncharacterized protein n=1 Tax=Portunus trituberculatus TaxID=210409 RepID=A0A5B7E455_PORTR|nr:hypothetical protein [Portunus trituberculatus]